MEFDFSLAYLAVPTVVFIAVGILIPLMFRKVVPTNEVHIVQTSKRTIPFGKDTGNGNSYYKWPTWVPILGVEAKTLSVSIFDIKLDAYDAYDKGRLQFLVDVMAFFRIADFSQAAQRVSTTQELKEQLTSIVQGSVRSILAKSAIEEIMEERSVFGQKFTSEVVEQLKAWGVEAVKNIELMDIKDAPKSEVIHNIMAKKKSHIEMESRTEVAKNQKLAQIAEIEATREVHLQEQEAQQQVGLRTVEAQQKVEIAQETKKQNVIEQTKLTTEREMEVKRIASTKTAEIEKDVAIVNSNRLKEVAMIEANRQKDVAVIEANKNKEFNLIMADQEFQVRTKEADASLVVKKKTAEGDLEIKEKNAKGLEAEGLAKAISEKAMLLAPVEAQTTLAKEIGENKAYQEYLITLERVKADKDVGIAQASAIAQADIKVIANTGNVDAGIQSLGELFTSKGGTQLGAMIEGFKNTEAGKTVLNKAGL